MSYAARVLADSMAPCGRRLTTLEVVMPRIVLAEFNTHRMLSRNSASSRAIPIAKLLQRVRAEPFVPTYWGRNQKGMQAERELTADEQQEARAAWLRARDSAADHAERLLGLGLHKQLANRLLEPFLWHTVIVSATEWDNFFALRDHPHAAPEIREPARLMRAAMAASTPAQLEAGRWHLPLVYAEDFAAAETTDLPPLGGAAWAQISSARCARVSYLTHDGRRDLRDDLQKAVELERAGHMSPFEHAAMAERQIVISGNFRGFTQYRKTLPGEAVFAR